MKVWAVICTANLPLFETVSVCRPAAKPDMESSGFVKKFEKAAIEVT